jgi:hypothetical protein
MEHFTLHIFYECYKGPFDSGKIFKPGMNYTITKHFQATMVCYDIIGKA